MGVPGLYVCWEGLITGDDCGKGSEAEKKKFDI